MEHPGDPELGHGESVREGPWSRLPTRSARRAQEAATCVLGDDEFPVLAVSCPRVRPPASLWLMITNYRLLLIDARNQLTLSIAVGDVALDEGSGSRLRLCGPDREIVCPLANRDDRDAVQAAWRYVCGHDGSMPPVRDSGESNAERPPANPTGELRTKAASSRSSGADVRRPLTKVERAANTNWWFHGLMWLALAVFGGVLAYAGAIGLEEVTVLMEGVPLLHTPILERPIADSGVDIAAVLGGVLLVGTGLVGVRKAYGRRHEEVAALLAATRPARPGPSEEEKQHLPLAVGTLGWIAGWSAWAVLTDLPAWQASIAGMAVGVSLMLLCAAVVRPGNTSAQVKSLLAVGTTVSVLAGLVSLLKA
jgi:hypothetical protein